MALAEAGRPVACWDLDRAGVEKAAAEATERFGVASHFAAIDVTETARFEGLRHLLLEAGRHLLRAEDHQLHRGQVTAFLAALAEGVVGEAGRGDQGRGLEPLDHPQVSGRPHDLAAAGRDSELSRLETGE